MAKTARQMVEEANALIPALTPQEAWQRLEGGDVVLLDVREPTEWETHIAGASRSPEGSWRPRRTRPAPDTTRRWTPASRSSSTAGPELDPCWPP